MMAMAMARSMVMRAVFPTTTVAKPNERQRATNAGPCQTADEPRDLLTMSNFTVPDNVDPEILKAIFSPLVELPAVQADLAMQRRLHAMHLRMLKEDEPGEDPTTFEEVVYCAIMGGLRESERDAGALRNENTGLPLLISPYRDPHPRRTRIRRVLKIVFPFLP